MPWRIIRLAGASAGNACTALGGFILDGFPRTMVQAVAPKQFLERDRLGLTAVISYELPRQRDAGSSAAKAVSSASRCITSRIGRPKAKACCHGCEGKLLQREDDRPGSIEVRLQAYDRSTPPLVDFYRKAGLLFQVSARGRPQQEL